MKLGKDDISQRYESSGSCNRYYFAPSDATEKPRRSYRARRFFLRECQLDTFPGCFQRAFKISRVHETDVSIEGKL